MTHPFLRRFAAGRLTRWQLWGYASQHYHLVRFFTAYLEAIASRTPDAEVRMEQLADPGSIVITPDTLALSEGFVEVKSLGPVTVKGVADPIEVYEMLGASTVRSRFQAAAMRGLTKFVGRAAEIEQLRQALLVQQDFRARVQVIPRESVDRPEDERLEVLALRRGE